MPDICSCSPLVFIGVSLKVFTKHCFPQYSSLESSEIAAQYHVMRKVQICKAFVISS